MTFSRTFVGALSAFVVFLLPFQANANAYREKNKTVEVGKSGVVVTPSRDWNRLDIKLGRYAETWTLDGEQLNDVTFFTGVAAGHPILRERNRKREPLPKFNAQTLLIEVPELLGATYRTYKKIGNFTVTTTEPRKVLGQDGIEFTFDYTDQDELPRKGNGRATIINKKLYLMTFDAPRLHFFGKVLPDYSALVDTAKIGR